MTIQVQELTQEQLRVNIPDDGEILTCHCAGFTVHQDAPEFNSAFHALSETYNRFVKWHTELSKGIISTDSNKNPWHIYCLFFAVQTPPSATPPDPFAPFDTQSNDATPSPEND